MDEIGVPSEFEQRRLDHVCRTAEYIKLLGVRSREALVPPRRLRRSRPDEGAKKAQDASEAEEADIVQASREWLRKSRAAILAPGLGGEIPASGEEWRREAVRRWGDAVPDVGPTVTDWEGFVRSRLPSPPPPSPMDFMQERYAYDIWRLLAACALMTRISSEKVKEDTIARFFLASPTPSALLATLEQPDGEGCRNLKELLRPLGMVDSRIKTLTELSQRFLSMPEFECGHQKGVNKIWGCGPFAVDSCLIFCRGRRLAETADASCQSYLDWWRETEPGETCTQESAPKSKDQLTPPKRSSANSTTGGATDSHAPSATPPKHPLAGPATEAHAANTSPANHEVGNSTKKRAVEAPAAGATTPKRAAASSTKQSAVGARAATVDAPVRKGGLHEFFQVARV